MSIWDQTEVMSEDGSIFYEENVDYTIDPENDAIARIPGGSIPDGGTVRVIYSKGVDSAVTEELKTSGSAVMMPLTAIVKILENPGDDMFKSGEDISESVTRLELIQDLSAGADEVKLMISNRELFSGFDPSDDVVISVAFGEIDRDGISHYTESFRGLVSGREIISKPDSVAHILVNAKDFSIALDSPRQSAMGRVWSPRLRREVFLNGAIIADDYRDLRNSVRFDTIDLDDVIEIHFAKEHPRAHQVILDCFNSGKGDYLQHISIDCLDFPVIFMDGRTKSPLEVIREIATIAGASVKAEGNTLDISERGYPSGFKTAWVYEDVAIFSEGEENRDKNYFNAVQVFGHCETSRLPTRSAYLSPTDFTMPGWSRVLDEEGTLDPGENDRSDEIPQPAELHFQIDGALYDASGIRVLGGELAKMPSVEFIDGRKVINITVNIDWLVEDVAGEPPYVEDEFGNRLYRIKGRVYDAVPSAGGEKLPIPHAIVTREKLDGDDAGDTFDINADVDGYYLFEVVPMGSYKIIADAPGYLDNFSDDDPGNDEYRDLYLELLEYENAIAEGRYEKKPTDYHVIVWARPLLNMGPLADLTVSQVLLEIRDSSTLIGGNISYSPAVRDDRVTTEVLAKRIGKVLISSASQEYPSFSVKLPMNRWLKSGDGIRLSGDTLGTPLPASRTFQATRVKRIFDPQSGSGHDIVDSNPGSISSLLRKSLRDDPLDTQVGIVVAVYRNEVYGRVYDVAMGGTYGGRIFYGLKAGPILGEVLVGETVQVAKPSSGSMNYIIAARTTEIFGKERIVYV